MSVTSHPAGPSIRHGRDLFSTVLISIAGACLLLSCFATVDAQDRRVARRTDIDDVNDFLRDTERESPEYRRSNRALESDSTSMNIALTPAPYGRCWRISLKMHHSSLEHSMRNPAGVPECDKC